jgi:Chaperone of endosialidase
MKIKTITPLPIRCRFNLSTLQRFNVLMVAIALACFGLASAPKAFGVVPAPDGGYPGFNTAEGQNALLSLTTGVGNTAVGWFSLKSNTEANFNTGVGAGTLLLNTAKQNTATGAGALLSNTTGDNHTANGAFALFNNTTGSDNTATGNTALFSNTAGFGNTATGGNALFSNIEGDENTANGLGALFGNTTGGANTAIGSETLLNNTTGGQNTAVGVRALQNNSIGNGNIALGVAAGTNVTTAQNVICIGNAGQNVSQSCYIGNIFGVTASGGAAVFINGDGQLGTTTSSRRYKEEIRPMEEASETLYALKPVTFRYKKRIDPLGISQFGLVAEDVEKINPDLVVRDKEGKVNTVRYDAVNAMLLNEFLKEHKIVQAQQATISELKSTVAQQKKGMEVLTAQLKEQAAALQNVSDQLERNRHAPQLVVNP